VRDDLVGLKFGQTAKPEPKNRHSRLTGVLCYFSGLAVDGLGYACKVSVSLTVNK
jgi:hypothetical protein